MRIEAGNRVLEGRIEWRDGNGEAIGEQAFPSRSSDCAELTRAMGFALALQIQLMAATVEEAGSPALPPVISVATKPPPPPTAAAPSTVQLANVAGASPPGARSRGPSVLVGAGVSLGVGVSPDVVGLGRLFATAEWSHAAVELASEVTLPSTTGRPDGSAFSQQEFLASLAGCGVFSPLSACAVSKVGDLRVRGKGVDVPLSASGLMIESGLRLAVSHSFVNRTYVAVRVEGLSRFTQSNVTLDSMTVWTTPRFVAVMGIDFALRFR